MCTYIYILYIYIIYCMGLGFRVFRAIGEPCSIKVLRGAGAFRVPNSGIRPVDLWRGFRVEGFRWAQSPKLFHPKRITLLLPHFPRLLPRNWLDIFVVLRLHCPMNRRDVVGFPVLGGSEWGFQLTQAYFQAQSSETPNPSTLNTKP